MTTILFFRKTPPFQDDLLKDREKSLRDFFRMQDARVVVGYSPYDYPESSDFIEKASRITGPVLVLSWQSTRVTRILMRKIGPEINLGQSVFIDLSETENDAVVTRIREFSEQFPEKAEEENTFVEEPRPPVKRWYPVIDETACVSCLECVNFCLFGVYTIDRSNRPLVTKPDACRDGCPACSRVCPAGAILFPEYDDPVISGRVASVDANQSNQPEINQPDEPKPDNLMDRLDDFSL